MTTLHIIIKINNHQIITLTNPSVVESSSLTSNCSDKTQERQLLSVTVLAQ